MWEAVSLSQANPINEYRELRELTGQGILLATEGPHSFTSQARFAEGK
jgi:hypothetical protein